MVFKEMKEFFKAIDTNNNKIYFADNEKNFFSFMNLKSNQF